MLTHLLCSVIEKGLDLILTESLVVLRGRDGPRLLEPLDTPRVDTSVETMFAQEQTILNKIGNNVFVRSVFSNLFYSRHLCLVLDQFFYTSSYASEVSSSKLTELLVNKLFGFFIMSKVHEYVQDVSIY